MSLLDEAFESFVIVNKSQVSDGYGGVITIWTDGAEIQGAMVLDNSTQMKVAQAMGVTSTYTLTVHKDLELSFHTVLRRKSDNETFRLTTDTDDKKTPKSAGLNMRQYSAELFTIPRGD